MRIPNYTISDSLVMRLQKLLSKQAALQSQVSSGQRITTASDDPAAMARVLDVQAEKQSVQQWVRNGDRALAVSQASFSAVKHLKSISDRAGEIAVLGVGATGADAYRAYAAEVNSLLEQAVQVTDSKHAGDRLFGGTRTDAPPFTVTRDVAGQITAVTYAGSAAPAAFRVSDSTTIAPQTDGATNQKFGDFINNLVALRDALAAQSGPAVQAAHTALRTSETDIIVTMSDIGATQTRLEAVRELNGTRFLDLDALTSADTDVDIAQTVVKLTQTQAAYEAALKSGAEILRTSLLDYLR
jgi:flagellar hook-associated protein 3 FlgL